MATEPLQCQTVEIFGTKISSISREDACEIALKWRERGGNRPLCIAFPSLNPIFMSVLEKPFAGLYDNMDLVLPDGRNISRVARVLGDKLPEKRIAGMDFLPEICRRAGQDNQTIAAVVPDKETGERFSEALNTKYHFHEGQVKLVWLAPYVPVFRKEDLQELIAGLNDSQPDIIAIGIASPKQEGIGRILRAELKYGATILCIGGAMHTTAGIIKMAPSWVRNLGLESFYRFWQEPRRLFRRYIVYNSVLLFFLAKAIFKRRILHRGFLE